MLADCIKKLLDGLNVLKSGGLHGELAILDAFLHLFAVVLGDGAMVSQIALAAYEHNEDLVV